MPNRTEVENLVGSAVYGFLESKAVKEADFLMDSIPRPIEQLGYAGGIALALRVVNSLALKNRYVGILANAAAHAFMYQVGRAGELPKASKSPATVSGDFLGDDDVGSFLDEHTMGALDAEGSIGDIHEMEGVPFMEPNPGT